MATTGQPSISPVKALDLRSINNALNEVRQQLITLNNAIVQVGKVAGQNAFSKSTDAQLLAQLQAQVAALAQQVSSLTGSAFSLGNTLAFAARHG